VESSNTLVGTEIMARIIPLVTDAQGEEISKLAARLSGLSVESVDYLTTAALEASEAASDLHVVDQAVALGLDDGTSMTVAWAMDGYLEGLAFVSASFPEVFRPEVVASIGVSASHLWQAVIGRRIDTVAVAAHISNEGCPQTIWSVRLGFDDNVSVVIALGDIGEGVPEYRPDGLVVIGDMAIARRYMTPSGETSLGTIVPLK
jgi:hypothetical protein